jgi:iron complex outermembrane receptor protein
LAPPINLLEVVGSPTSVKPEETWNYQGGTAFKQGRWVLGLDAYYIDFTNYITTLTIGGQTGYVNGGGAIYEGVEFEGQYVLDHGVSLYGNATYNSAQSTGAAGVLFDDRKGPYASLIAKWIGPRFGLDVPLSGVGHANSYGLDGYVTADLAAGWRFRDLAPFLRDFTASVKVSNLFDSRIIDDYAGQQSATSTAFPNGAPLFWTVAGRSVFVNLSASF